MRKDVMAVVLVVLVLHKREIGMKKENTNIDKRQQGDMFFSLLVQVREERSLEDMFGTCV